MLSEKKLIEGCIASDRTAQRQLYEQYSPSFFALCLRYMPTRTEAEDVMIMGFTTIFEKINTFKDEGSFEGWMKKVMIRTAISAIRMNEKRSFQINDETLLDNVEIAMSQNVTYSAIGVKDIMRQVRRLPEGCRSVFNLYAIEGYSYEEIANMLSISGGTVRSQLARARKILQEALKEYR